MKKVLFVSHTTDFVKFNVPFIKWFNENGWSVHYASMEEKDFPQGLVDIHYKIPFSRSPFSKSNICAYKELKKVINENEYDLIHCHTPVGGVVARLAARRARKYKNTRVIYTGHGFHFYKGASIISWMIFYPIEKIMSFFSDAVVTINSEDYELAMKKFSCNVYKICGVGVNSNRFFEVSSKEKEDLRKALGFHSSQFIMIYAAELNKNKNQIFLVKMMPEILEKIPEATLLLAGYGDMKEEIIALVNELELENSVQILGYRNDIDKLYQMSDLGISVSIREGLGLNVLEEMACGLPVIATANRGHKEIIENEINGFLIEQNDKSKFIEKIELIYKDETLRNKISHNNIRKARRYSVECSLEQMVHIYQEIITK